MQKHEFYNLTNWSCDDKGWLQRYAEANCMRSSVHGSTDGWGIETSKSPRIDTDTTYMNSRPVVLSYGCAWRAWIRSRRKGTALIPFSPEQVQTDQNSWWSDGHLNRLDGRFPCSVFRTGIPLARRCIWLMALKTIDILHPAPVYSYICGSWGWT